MSTNQDIKTKLDSQYRTLLILWLAFLSMFVIYYFLPVAMGWHPAQENRVLLIVFNVLSPLLVVSSFLVKRKLLARSVETQDARLVNTGFIVSAALCEAGALIGLLDGLAAQDGDVGAAVAGEPEQHHGVVDAGNPAEFAGEVRVARRAAVQANTDDHWRCARLQ